MPHEFDGKRARTRRAVVALLVAWAIGAASASSVRADSHDAAGQARLPTIELLVGERALLTELAISAEQRYRGLGNRRELAPDAAMLFVYSDARMLTFTMRDTRLPLSIAFLSDVGSAGRVEGERGAMIINEIIDMDVGPNQLFPSTRPARYALEVNQGWFRKHGIRAGATIRVGDGALR